MGVFKFARNKGKEIIADRNKVAEKAIRKEVEDLGLDDGLGGDLKVTVDGKQVKLEGKVPDQETKEKLILAAGNASGMGEVDDSMKAKSKAKVGQSVKHMAKSGDSLSKIAKKYYSDAKRCPDVFDANTPMLKHPDQIYQGQVLRIPGT